MLVQAFYFYFALPQLVQAVTGSQFRITVFTASLVTLALNAGAYISEIFRGSIESVNKGQMEAARSLGLSYAKSMQKIKMCIRDRCHDITQIIKGVTKDAVFRKGHVITEEDIPVLLSVGKDNVYIWEKGETRLHENEAAEILREMCRCV